MRIVSWNVNGLRACIDKGFWDFFDNIDADIFCVQEVKMEEKQFRYSLPNYEQYWNSAEKKGYAGTVIFAKRKARKVFYGIDGLYCNEGRVITLEYDDYYIINCYSPHSQRNLNHLVYKRAFDLTLTQYIEKLKKRKSVILCGDLNIAYQEIDLKNYKSNRNNAGFTDGERSDFEEIIKRGFIDSYRYRNPQKTGAYTWWSYRKGVREKNIGWRIDYILLVDELIEKLEDSNIYSNIYGSDHCPIGIDINI